MKPILFNESATTFTTNGIGRLDCISCKVTEERNGMYELEAVIAEGSQHYSDLAMSKIIVARPFDGGTLQPFRIYKITKPINGKSTVYAQHISYQLSYIPTMPFSIVASSSACSQTLAALKSNAAESCPFNFSTDVTTVASYHHDVPFSIRQRLGGIEGSVLDQFGGEYEWDNYNVILHANRGVTNPTVTLRYGKNITDIEQEEYISNTITGVCPFWRASDGSQVVTLPEKVIESQYASNYPFRRTVPLDLSESFEEAPTAAQLRASATAAVNEQGIGIPTVSIKVSFVALWQTEEYKDIAPLQRVKLCDRVNVQFEKLGISETAKVVKTVYDVLAERYDSIEIGAMKSSLAQAITDVNGAITGVLQREIFDVRNATAWLTSSNGYVMAVKNNDGSWKELLFMDTDDAATAHNVLRINENGLGFSSNGVSGPYTQAWTLDGRMVIGGTNVPSLTVYDNNNNILFQIDKNGLEWNASKSSMTKAGKLTASEATLSSVTISGGSLSVYDSNNNLIFQTDKDGTMWSATNSSMTKNGTLTIKNGIIEMQGTHWGSPYKIQIKDGQIKYYDGNNQLVGCIDMIYSGSSGQTGAGLVISTESGKNLFLDPGGKLELGGIAMSGLYVDGYEGITDSFTLQNAGGGTTRLVFRNGILV